MHRALSIRRAVGRRARLLGALALGCAVGVTTVRGAVTGADAGTFTMSIVGTSDLHGYFMPRASTGGVEVFAGYVNNLRAARARDNGAVVLLDAGDTFQGGVESDLSEGAVVVDAYNALGYTALAIGNHEFAFGAADDPGARQNPRADPQGAVKARAVQARFPFLAANLLDASTHQPVRWPNVQPSVLVTVGGVKVGIVGAMTAAALRATLPLNVRGLEMAPLTSSVAAQAARLRQEGARIVILTAHAGGWCDRFDDPHDIADCDNTAEIFTVARELPPGLVDAIVAGHTHAALAHDVAGIPIVQSYWGGRAFGRIDLQVDRATGRVAGAKPFAPRSICLFENAAGTACAAAGEQGAVRSMYEGRPVAVDEGILRAMEPALARVRSLQSTPLGVVLDETLARAGDPESPLGNMFADALREQVGADVALNNNSFGGLRADLPGGPLTFGQLYDTFPFDNRLVRVRVTGDLLEQGIANALRRGRRGTFGISGARVRVSCVDRGLRIQLFRATGQPILPSEPLVIAGMDSLLGGQMFASVLPPGSIAVSADAPIVREVVEDWLRTHAGRLDSQRFRSGEPRLRFADQSSACLAQ
jgi:5'-nucleotidase